MRCCFCFSRSWNNCLKEKHEKCAFEDQRRDHCWPSSAPEGRCKILETAYFKCLKPCSAGIYARSTKATRKKSSHMSLLLSTKPHPVKIIIAASTKTNIVSS